MQAAHETEMPTKQKPLIGVGPNMQHRADQIGGRLVKILDQQAQSMTLTLRLYKRYRIECEQRGLAPKRVT